MLTLLCGGHMVVAEETRRISFSFDDAPMDAGPLLDGRARTNMLIAALDATGIRGAAFFVLTQSLVQNPDGAERLRAYADAGHVLANHTHTHPWLRATEPPEYLADIDRAAEMLAVFDNVQPYFRYPYLDEGNTRQKRLAVIDGLQTRGLSNGYVTIDTYDWYMQALVAEAVEAGHQIDMRKLGQIYVEILVETIEFYDALALQTLGRHPDHVLLLHENDLAAMFVDDLAEALTRDGWEIIPVAEAYTDTIADMQPDTQFNGQGRVAAIAHSNGAHPRQLVSPTEEEDILRARFVASGLLPRQ
ncbi:polysaccharide deacetylase family protein [Tateyamaria omphalii]|uniref:polysaccharide deacetylase family protein n=1 Tax=Tateyamaria omphalii TaxID=299262 RepID=UPI001678868A|nr:polysaccharide deacetylase family protein [Tateyamaria omphalii]